MDRLTKRALIVTGTVLALAAVYSLAAPYLFEYCEVHGVRLRRDCVPIIGGDGWNSPPYEEQAKNFPNANTQVLAGCMRGPERTQEVLYCKTCRKVQAKWYEARDAARRAALLERIRNASNINARDADGFAFLHTAALEGHTNLVRLLISKGAKVAVKTRGDRLTPLRFAVMANHPEIVKALIDAGAEVKNLHFAVICDRPEIVKVLIDAGADVNAKDEKGMTPLYLARRLFQADPQVVAYLIEAGAIEKPDCIRY